MARQNIRLGNVLGIEIGISFSWFVIFGLVTVLLAVAYFPQNYPNEPRYLYLVLGLITSVLFFGSVLLHEITHAVVARLNNIPIRSITLFIFGGVAQMDRDADNPAAEFLMAAAGPVASVALAALFAGVYAAANALGLGILVAGPALYLAFINFYLALFNLVPGFPLDGGRILRAILWYVTGDVRKSTRIASTFGQGFAVVLILTGLFMFLFTKSLWFNGIWFIFLGIFLWQVASAGYEDVVMHRALDGVKVRDIMTTDTVTVPAATMVEDLVNDYFMRHKHSRFPVVDDELIIGVVTLDDVKGTPREAWARTRTRAVTPPLGENEIVSPEATAEEAIPKIQGAGRGHLVVMEDGNLVGIVTMNDLVNAIKLRQNLGG